MLLDSECSKDCNLLSKDDFTDKVNISIFQAIRSLVQREKPVDYLTIYQELKQEISVTYLSDLTNSMPTTANFKVYVNQLKDLTLKRQLANLGRSLADKNKTGKELIEYAESEIFALSEK